VSTTETPAPRFPAYDASLGDDDDFGPEPDPALYRVAEPVDRAAAARQVAGRRAAARNNAEQGIATKADAAILTEAPVTGTTLTYNGQTVATAQTVEPFGINYRVVWSTGFANIFAPSQMSADLLAMATEVAS
jgi:hypothetical protein